MNGSQEEVSCQAHERRSRYCIFIGKILINNSLLLALLFSFPATQAQTINSGQSYYWLRYYNQWMLSQKWTWHNEIDNRRLFTANTENQLIAHTHIHYTSGKWEPALGATVSWQHNHNPITQTSLTIPEVRPFQEITFKVKHSKSLASQQRLRVDERFIHNTTAGERTNGYRFVLRLRYRAQVSIQVNPKIILKANDELFINTKGLIFDQNRVYAGAEYLLSKTFGAELGYMHLYQQRQSDVFAIRNVCRFTLYHRINRQ